MSSSRPQRQRVVLSQRRGTRMVRTRVELQEQTEVGDALVRGLVRAQLALALRLGVLVLACLAALAVVHTPNRLLLGVLIYPALYGVGRLFIRLAEQGERDFLRIVDAGEEP